MTTQTGSEAPMLRSWTPMTTEHLERGGSLAWNILDHAVETPLTFCSDLRTELSTHWLSKVRPARTQGDVSANHILSLVHGAIGVQTDQSLVSARGDKSIFIGRDERSQVDFRSRHPCMCYLIDAIQNTAEHNLGMTLDLSLTSVQLAVYPGDGTSGYPRHCDRSGQQSKQESTESTTLSLSSERIITAVYYLTPPDWSAELDGGCLRLFSESTGHYDVVPHSNRLVLFRSDGVEHQVLPSLRRARMALTIWLYGHAHSPSPPTRLPVVHSPWPDEPLRSTGGPPPLPVSTESDDDVNSTIFVSIAAYRDSEIGPTLRSLMAMACHPKRVFVGMVHQIVEQTDESILKSLPTDSPWYDSQVTCLTLDARHARGACWARDLCQRLYADQDYVLQIDSHMRFRRNWDTYLIHQLQTCSEPQKSLLTAYPVGYTLPNEIPDETRGTLLVPWKFGEDGMLRQRGRTFRPRSDNMPCHLYAAGFNFAPGSIIEEVPYDGRLRNLFFGEEMSMAVRLFTHGYNLYAPPETVCYHLWSRSHRPAPLAVTPETQRAQEKQRKASLAVVQQQLRGEGPGLGTERTAFEFALALGVDFERQTISADSELGGLPREEFLDDKRAAMAPESLERQMASLDSQSLAKIASFLGGLNS